MQTIITSLLLLHVFISCLPAQTPWTEKDKAHYAANRADSSTWNMEMFIEDLESFIQKDWPTEPAISNYPSPVPKYDWGYGYLGNMEINIDGKRIEGNSIGFAKDKYRNHLLYDSTDYYINYFNIFIWTDIIKDEAGANTISSRNYPHYFSSGKQKTSFGEVDWMHMNLADGQNFVVVNQRYYDLTFGKTILVKALKDGSLRILQIDDEIGSLSSGDIMNDRKDQALNPKYQFLDRLSNNISVKDFFLDERMLETKN